MSNEEVVEDSGVIQIWENLPTANKAVSVASVVLYLLTGVLALGTMSIVPWYITVGLLVWPMMVIAWLAVIWVLFALVSVASVLFQGKISASTARARWAQRLAKTIVFVPTVIGGALAVVDVFAKEIFQGDEDCQSCNE